MNYQKFDINTWNRKEHFNHYRDQLRCGFSLTTKIDITKLIPFIKEHNYKFYPVIIYLITKAVNTHREFRFAIKEGELIVWDTLNPAYTVLHPDTETFSELRSTYTESLSTFIAEYDRIDLKYKEDYSMTPVSDIENIFHISMLPWISFDGFNLNVPDFGDYFVPIFTLGKYTKNDDQILMPLSIQVHHATCDGLHVAKLLNTLQQLCTNIQDLN